jgi:hypothetical protein
MRAREISFTLEAAKIKHEVLDKSMGGVRIADHETIAATVVIVMSMLVAGVAQATCQANSWHYVNDPGNPGSYHGYCPCPDCVLTTEGDMTYFRQNLVVDPGTHDCDPPQTCQPIVVSNYVDYVKCEDTCNGAVCVIESSAKTGVVACR